MAPRFWSKADAAQLRAAANPIDETLIVTHADTARLRPAQLRAQPARVMKRALTRLSVAAMAFGLAALGSADGALRAPSSGGADEKPTAETAVLIQAPPVIWAVDKDGDGATDYYNPTHGAVRGDDAFGSGDFGASRDGGKRKHEGVDYVIAPGAPVHAPIAGEVARLGYAYRGEGGYRIVEIVNSETKVKARVLYVAPTVEVGDVVVAGQEIGSAQDLNARYPGITNHVHVELRDRRQQLIDATEELPAPAMRAQRRVVGQQTT
ncbi:MAG TPA: peptidoglycan DD-metalloendopeptidase family protein [Candidatus Binatia bacterium]|nr:peptidoglycan DD-metalloendopeptidase family protein [Candidatus Binatia bacterium]